MGISTSGNSKNVIEAFQAAKAKGIKCLALLGCGGGKLSEIADLSIIIPSDNTPRVQECHETIIHIICGIVEKEIFS